MSPEDTTDAPRPDSRSPWVINTRELGRRPGQSTEMYRDVATSIELGVPDVVTIPAGTPVTLDLLLESVVEGVLVTGSASAPTAGYCVRCLDPVKSSVEAQLTELFAYPDSTTEETTESDEVSHIVDEMIDLEPEVRDALVLGLPHAPVCSEDCSGLCDECGEKWADLEPGHRHEKIDPRWAALVDRLEDLSGETSDGTSDEAPTGRPDDTP